MWDSNGGLRSTHYVFENPERLRPEDLNGVCVAECTSQVDIWWTTEKQVQSGKYRLTNGTSNRTDNGPFGFFGAFADLLGFELLILPLQEVVKATLPGRRWIVLQ